MWKPGQSGNPARRPKTPEWLKNLKTSGNQHASKIFYEKITDPEFMRVLSPLTFLSFCIAAWDYFGEGKAQKLAVAELPRVPEFTPQQLARIAGGENPMLVLQPAKQLPPPISNETPKPDNPPHD